MEFPIHKILFVIFDDFKSERLGIQILSSIALEEGYNRELVIINELPIEEGLKKARAYQPDIVAYSAMTYEHAQVLEFNRLLKQLGLKFISIFGGHHFTFNPEIIFEDDNVDIVCIGEGEVTFRSFIRAVRGGKDYQDIEKLWVRQEDAVIQNPVGSLIRDLDTIPFPDRNLLLNDDSEGAHLHGNSVAVMFGRGCPNKCSYCYNVKYNTIFHGSRIFRYRSVDNLIQELKQIVQKRDYDIIAFYDDCFSYLPKKIITEFCQRYKQEIKRPFSVQMRPDRLREDVVVMLKEAGMCHCRIGVECGNEYVAHHVLQRGKISNEDIVKAFEILHKHKIETWAFNLMALPVDNPLEVDMETIKLNMKLKPYWAQFNVLLPIPKTPIWGYAIQNGYLNEDSVLHSDKLPSNFTKTEFTYKDPALAAKVTNLHKFASPVVKFPFLLPLVKILIMFPPNRIYQYFFFLWYGYYKSIASLGGKFSLKSAYSGLKAIKKYLEKH